MLSGWVRIAALATVAAALAGCGSDQAMYGELPSEAGPDLAREMPEQSPQQMPLQCVTYAREHSSVKLHGDAWTWWNQAAGKFSRQSEPETGAVMVLAGYAGPQSGHVAVVRAVVSSREIHVDHANWLNDEAIYLDDPVADVSEANDWSRIRVWNIKTGGWGSTTYRVQGFIGPGSERPADSIATLVQDAGQDRISRLDPN
jgi:surface antigen